MTIRINHKHALGQFRRIRMVLKMFDQNMMTETAPLRQENSLSVQISSQETLLGSTHFRAG
jgi:hypothetical protein